MAPHQNAINSHVKEKKILQAELVKMLCIFAFFYNDITVSVH